MVYDCRCFVVFVTATKKGVEVKTTRNENSQYFQYDMITRREHFDP